MWALDQNFKRYYERKKLVKITLLIIIHVGLWANAEQTRSGKVSTLQINHYNSGAAYVEIEGANFTECNTPTTWCAIDFSLPGSNQMYSAVLAAKMAGKNIQVTTNGCWSTNYARCWKVYLTE